MRDGRRLSLLFLQYELALGATALSTATFSAAKQRDPQVRIAVACAGLSANVLRASPLVDELIVTPHPLRHPLAAALYFLGRILPRRRQFDWVLTDTSHGRLKIAGLALLSGIRPRIGYSSRPYLFETALTEDKALSSIANNLRLLDGVGLPGPAQTPAIHFNAADLAKAKSLLDEADPLPGPVLAMVTQASKGHPNEWFDDRWVALSRRLIERLGARLVFVGTKADATAIDRIRSAIGAPTLSAAGRTDIPELAALLALCDLTVTIDTGGLHVARGVEAPAVVIGHAATPKQTWLPLDEPLYRILLHDYVPCAYCHRHVCATRECMQESTVDLVEAAVLEHLQAFPPSEAARAARVAARLAPQRKAG